MTASLAMTFARQPELTSLKKRDRCDRCSAEALFRVFVLAPEKDRLLPLDFCRHHFLENGEGLAKVSKHTIVKETEWDK